MAALILFLLPLVQDAHRLGGCVPEGGLVLLPSGFVVLEGELEEGGVGVELGDVFPTPVEGLLPDGLLELLSGVVVPLLRPLTVR